MPDTLEHLTISEVPGNLTVRHHDAVLASSERALKVTGEREGAAYYLPRADVYTEHMSPLGPGNLPDGRRVTFLTITASGGGLENAAWEVADDTGGPLSGHIGFDPGLVGLTGL
ncbi:DUF427 domain-containing protein [Aureimonas sp. OT7]|uniref:DUF427 domain-containing protein n=1 Tax=Aureimonas TaxID=414371 RepID=UPI001781BEE2|nr:MULTISPECIES: DUF427 domain-containing protein [Aureimonas]QOG05876.1 DUF427 domain-containing protein [Aureimonas sp. OT7]